MIYLRVCVCAPAKAELRPMAKAAQSGAQGRLIKLHKGLVIVAEWGNGRVQVFNAKGDSILVVNGFPHAHDVVADDDGGVFVALYSHKRVRKLKISVYEDGTPSFSIEEEYKQLELHPTSVLEENGRIRFVSKTRVQDVEF